MLAFRRILGWRHPDMEARFQTKIILPHRHHLRPGRRQLPPAHNTPEGVLRARSVGCTRTRPVKRYLARPKFGDCTGDEETARESSAADRWAGTGAPTGEVVESEGGRRGQWEFSRRSVTSRNSVCIKGLSWNHIYGGFIRRWIRFV